MRVEKLACSPCCAQEKGADAKIQHKCFQVFVSHTERQHKDTSRDKYAYACFPFDELIHPLARSLLSYIIV